MPIITNNPQERRQGTGFTNLNRILDANKQNVLGQTIGGGIQQQAQGVRTGLNEQTQQFQQDAASSRVGTDENRQLTQDVLGRFNSQSGFSGVQEPEIQKFQQIQAGYQGPMGLSQEKLGQLQGKAQTAQQLGQATRSAGGKDELLRQFVGGKGYTQGQQRLDSTLLGQTGSKDLAQARRSTFGLGQDLQKQQTAATEIGKQYQTEGQRFGQEVKGQLQGLFDPLQSTVQQRPDELRGQWENRRSELFTKLQNEDELSPQDMQDLGWTDEDALQYNLLRGVSGQERISGAKVWAPILMDTQTQKYGTDAYSGMADFLGIPVSGINGQASSPKYSDLANAVAKLTPDQVKAFEKRFTSGGGASFNLGVGQDLYDTISKATVGDKLQGLTADNDIGFGTTEAFSNLQRLAGRSDVLDLFKSGAYDNVNFNDPAQKEQAEWKRAEEIFTKETGLAPTLENNNILGLVNGDYIARAKKELQDFASLKGAYQGSGDNYNRYGTILQNVNKVTPDFAFENYIPQANLGDVNQVTASSRDELTKLNALRQLQGQEPIYSNEQLDQAGTAKLNVGASKEMLPYAIKDLLGEDYVNTRPDGTIENKSAVAENIGKYLGDKSADALYMGANVATAGAPLMIDTLLNKIFGAKPISDTTSTVLSDVMGGAARDIYDFGGTLGDTWGNIKKLWK